MIQVQVKGIEEVNTFLKSVPLGATKEATDAIGLYIIGNDQHGLKHYPKEKRVTRKQAYGVTFFSDRQRRWFFANLREGNIEIPYDRKYSPHGLQGGWKLSSPSKNTRAITNKVPYASLVMGDAFQNRMSQKIGWRKVSDVISSNIKGALRMGDLAVQRWIKAKNK